MSHSVHNPIEVYTDAACLIARDKLEILIYGLDEFVVGATTIIAITRLAETFLDRDMAQELLMPPAHRAEYERVRTVLLKKAEQHQRLVTDPEFILDTVTLAVGSCGQYYELWQPRMMQALAHHIRQYSVGKDVAAALWIYLGLPEDGPTDQDWADASDMESDVRETIREDQE